MQEDKFKYGAVIILGQSELYNEMRGNRYHYATRFAKLAPVFFVQGFNRSKTSFIENADNNITVVNPFFDKTKTLQTLFGILRKKNIDTVLFWIYSPLYTDVLRNINFKFSAIYHSTEAYLGSDMLMTHQDIEASGYLEKVRKTVNFCNFSIGVSEGVSRGIEEDPGTFSPVYTVTNGCDFTFWNGFGISKKERKNIAIYQGGIHRKLDFKLLLSLVDRNPDVTFWFCGDAYFDFDDDEKLWKTILSRSNVKYWGNLHPEEVRNLSHQAKVGLIPFKKNDYLVNKAFPLKAFEYLSAGLDVITTPMTSLNKYQKYFKFSDSYEILDTYLKESIKNDQPYTEDKITVCKQQDYDTKFKRVLELIENKATLQETSVVSKYKKNVLLLYDVRSCHVNAIREHVNAFGYFSRHQITYFNATAENNINEVFLNSFDAVVVHYSVRISVPGHFSENIVNKLGGYKGPKILFIQDEYDNLKSTYDYMRRIDFDTVFTCVPKAYHDYVYPEKLFPGLRFVNNLTGYLSYDLSGMRPVSIKNRKVDVFYRGRKLPYFYGTLGVEKHEIGIKFKEKEQAIKAGLITDLESDDSQRIYGNAWIAAISGSKTMLGTESGSNLFDFNGDLRQRIDEDVKAGFTYNDIFEKYIRDEEKKVKMNQISPKVFEAMSLKTVLILYEGEYSNILEPDRHYIPLKKDFSNFSEVVATIEDDEKLQKIADTAYEEIVKNDKYSYSYFIRNNVDKAIDESVIIFRDQAKENNAADNEYDQIVYTIRKKISQAGFSEGLMVSTITSNESELLTGKPRSFAKIVWRLREWIKSMYFTSLTYLPKMILIKIWRGVGRGKDFYSRKLNRSSKA